jgi:hypothetical protein
MATIQAFPLLLPRFAQSRRRRSALQARTLSLGIRVTYGENYRVLHTQQLPEKGNQMDPARTTRESDPVRLRGSAL